MLMTRRLTQCIQFIHVLDRDKDNWWTNKEHLYWKHFEIVVAGPDITDRWDPCLAV